MPPPTNVRIRGIYTTALTALLLQQGYTIVDASPVIQERLGLPYRNAPADVRISDRSSRQGILVEGEPEHACAVVGGLQNALPQALFAPAPSAVRALREGGGGGSEAPQALPARYRAEFPATVKAQLDHCRARTTPTLPGHHALKIVEAGAVDAAEATLAADPGRAAALARRLREALVYRHFQPGAEVLVRHVKSGQAPIKLRGQVQQFQAGTLVLVRHFRGGGTYDGLGLPKEQGDWGSILLTEGAWVTVRRYFRREGTLIGELYNIGTPVEFYADHLRYVDLELDVAHLPTGTSRLEDAEVLADKLARGLLPPALGQEASRIACELLRQLAVASAPRDRQPCPGVDAL